MGIAPLHRRVPMKHMAAVTFQSVSGRAGRRSTKLQQQVCDYGRPGKN
jgi:aspartate-semialdehyde dehydrogenase